MDNANEGDRRLDIEELRTQIAGEPEAEVEADIRNDLESEDVNFWAEEVRQAVENSIASRRPTRLEGRADDKTTNRGKAQEVRKVVLKVLMAAPEDKVPLPEALRGAQQGYGAEVLKRVSQKIKPEYVTDETAPILYRFIKKALDGSIVDTESLANEARHLIFLKELSNPLYNRILEGLKEQAVASGIAEDEASRLFEHRDKDDDFETDVRRGGKGFAELGIDYLHEYYGKEDVEALKAFKDLDHFADFAQTRREIVRRQLTEQGRSAEEIERELDERTSEDVEREMILRISKLFKRVDEEAPKEFFEHIIQSGGVFNSIQIIRDQLTRKIELLIGEAERSEEIPPALRGMKFFRRYSDETLDRKQVNTEEGVKDVYRMKVYPFPKSEHAETLAEFLHGLHAEMEHEFDARKYLHNIRAIMMRGKGEKGFWAQLSEYSSQISSMDIDSFLLLPDSEIFMTATRLYSKYLEEEFAQYDWIHQPAMFLTNFMDVRSPLEEKVLEDLKKLFPEVGRDDWRIRRALTMGIGIAKGVLLNEIEMAAWADPNVKEEDKGSPTFVSYYTNDNAALAALNPLHHFLRWQQEGVIKGPILFMQASGFHRGKGWDHSILWQRMNEFKESFLKGENVFQNMGEDEKLLIQLLPNIAKAGGIVTRGGWRLASAYEGWLKYKHKTEDGVQLEGRTLQVFEGWKALENIGYEVLLSFSNDKVNDDFLKKPSAEREEMFRYLNGKFINPGNGRTLEQEIERLRPAAEERIDKAIKERLLTRDQRDEFITIETYRTMLNRALIGVLRKRMPTKLIRIERNRQTPGGRRAWDKIREQLYGSDAERMNRNMDDLLMVEAWVRRETTREMKEFLRTNEDLSQFSTDDYVVDEEKIRRVIGEINSSQPQEKQINVEEIVRLYQAINSGYLQRDDYIDYYAEKIRAKDSASKPKQSELPFAIGTEELETSFLAFRAAGGSILTRALNDTASVEQNVADVVSHFPDLLHEVSIDPNRNIEKILESIEKIKKTVDILHGPDAAYRVAHHFAGMTIAYFKKDSAAKNIFTKFFRGFKTNSLAAEFTGSFRGVWEWETADIDNFVVALERKRIIPKNPYDLGAHPPKVEPRKFLGRESILGITFGKKMTYEKHTEYNGQRLRQDFHAAKKDISIEFINKYLPFILAYVIFNYITRALKEQTEGKKD